MKPQDPYFERAEAARPLVSDRAVVAVVRLGYAALGVGAGVGLVAYAMTLQPEHAADILGGLAIASLAGCVVAGIFWAAYHTSR